MNSKYVSLGREGMEVPLIGSGPLSREIVVLAWRTTVHPAGYGELDASGHWTASGPSVSLKLDARPPEADILNSKFPAHAAHCNQRPGQLTKL
jgi:hypothetical protein